MTNKTRGLFVVKDWFACIFFLKRNLSNPKPGHTTGGSGRSAWRSGRAGSGKIGCQQNYLPRKKKSTVPSKASKKRRLNVSPEARTSEILCKPTEEQNQRLTTGLAAGRGARFVPGCRPVERRLFVSVNPFHARHVREFPDMPCIKKGLQRQIGVHTLGMSGKKTHSCTRSVVPKKVREICIIQMHLNKTYTHIHAITHHGLAQYLLK